MAPRKQTYVNLLFCRHFFTRRPSFPGTWGSKPDTGPEGGRQKKKGGIAPKKSPVGEVCKFQKKRGPLGGHEFFRYLPGPPEGPDFQFLPPLGLGPIPRRAFWGAWRGLVRNNNVGGGNGGSPGHGGGGGHFDADSLGNNLPPSTPGTRRRFATIWGPGGRKGNPGPRAGQELPKGRLVFSTFSPVRAALKLYPKRSWPAGDGGF